MDKETLPPSLVGSVGFMLGKLSQRLSQLAAEHLAELGIQARHVGIMYLISHTGPTSQKRIGDSLSIDRTTMVSLVDDLEKAGLAARKPDPSDRRASLIVLTSAGQKVMQRAEKIVEGVEQDFLQPLNSLARKQFLTSLHLLLFGDEK